jgi:hypothetical protein
MAVSFIGGGNRSAGKETPPCRKKKDRQNNDQNKKDKGTKHDLQNTTQKTKD